MPDRKAELTRLLRAPGDGGELLPLIYDELRGIASQRMGGERSDHTLQATALVHEAYVRLVDHRAGWKDRRHFYSAAAEAMRRILIDHARKAKSQKRGGDRARLSITVAELVHHDDPDQLLALDDALTRLDREDPRAAEVARLRFYTGLGVEETALAMDISERTVMREWSYARARLAEFLSGGEEPTT